MTNSTTSTMSHSQIESQAVSQEGTNTFANIWLGFLFVVLGAAFFSTAVLIAWPVIANMIAG